jgi:hypothetical protein
MNKQEMAELMAAEKLEISSVFVPHSVSRNAANKPCLNWKVTLKRAGREVLTCDYGAGTAHCPAFGTKAPRAWYGTDKAWREQATAFECENGYAAKAFLTSQALVRDKARPILPDSVDVLYSLLLDASVLNHPTYESWAPEFGYDVDSRKGEQLYRACQEIALKLRAGLGDTLLADLTEAFSEY